MIKKINIFLVLLVLLVSISAVNAVDDNNETDVVNEASRYIRRDICLKGI